MRKDKIGKGKKGLGEIKGEKGKAEQEKGEINMKRIKRQTVEKIKSKKSYGFQRGLIRNRQIIIIFQK